MSSAKRMKADIPVHGNEDAEREFWTDHDSTDFIDWSQARPVLFPKLKPTLQTISLRLPLSMLTHLKVLANQRDVPYQSLLKMFLAERIEEELQKSTKREPAQ